MKNILIRPLITEKSISSVKDNKYSFEVHPNTCKVEIKKEVKKTYKVDAVDVNIINKRGKPKNFRGKIGGRTKNWKKAVIRVKKGQKIQGFDIKEEKKK